MWWARRQLQCAHEAAADEASALIPGGARALAECLVRLGRELTASGPARTLGVSGNGARSQLAVRVERLLHKPEAWRRASLCARWTPQISAVFVALASALLPIQTGLSGSILAVLATTVPARADAAENPLPPTPIMAGKPFVAPAAPVTEPPPITAPLPLHHGALLTAINKTSANSTVKVAEYVPATRTAPRLETAMPKPAVLLSIKFVSLPEVVSEDLGLDWVFGLSPTNNPTVETNHDWIYGSLQPVEISSNKAASPVPASRISHPEHLVIDRLRTDGQTAILTAEQSSALLRRIEQRTTEDILAAPEIKTFSGLRANVSSQSIQTCVTGARVMRDSNSAGVNYTTDNVALGIAVDIIPKLEDNGKWRLQVVATDTAFLGYDSDNNKGSYSVPGGKLLRYEVPEPHFRLMEADAQESLLPGQTLALRGPAWTESTKTKGHFLIRSKAKTVRQRLYIFVTPTLCSKPKET